MRELLAIRGVPGGQMAAILDWEMKGEDSVLPGMVPVDALAEAGNQLLTAGGRPVLKWERALGQRQGGGLRAPPPRLGVKLVEGRIPESEEQASVVERVTREARERMATKSDDARIPTELWLEHLMSEGAYPWKGTAWDSVEVALNVLRRYLVRAWRKRVTKSFFRWLDRRYQTEFLEIRMAKRLGGGPWYESAPGAPANQIRMVSCSEWIRDLGKYQWKGGNPSGYKLWHFERGIVCGKDLEAARDAVRRATEASWWEWDLGSAPFFWRWPEWYHKVMRDGLQIWVKRGGPALGMAPQRDTADKALKSKMVAKLRKVRERGYTGQARVSSLTSFFAVRKGEDDIRMVYDGTASGLNQKAWVPKFVLPTLHSHLRCVEEGTYMSDVDIGEMFLNFKLHPDLVPLCGVDFTLYFGEECGSGQKTLWEAWKRAGMGFKFSPYQTFGGILVADEVIEGDRKDPRNVFRWDAVRLNLPGSKGYNPGLPWVSKVRLDDGRIAADKVIYVDDARPTGSSKEECWKAARRVASMLNYLGIQDAPRKRRDASQTPGAWAGSVVQTGNQGVFVMVSQEKWDKAKRYVAEVRELIAADPNSLPRRRLEVIRGYLNHIVGTYDLLKPFLIGFHMTIDGWRKDRDQDGWRIPKKRRKLKDEDEPPPSHQPAGDLEEDKEYSLVDLYNWGEGLEAGTEEAVEPPARVKAAPRLKSDLEALDELMQDREPPQRRVRGPQGGSVVYGFGDASGAGFGGTDQEFPGGSTEGGEIRYEFGQWTTYITMFRSSNWRELANVCEGLETRALEGRLWPGLELFVGTDNSVTDQAYWKGYSSSQELSDIIRRMYVLQMRWGITIHLFHVAGSRMIAQGTDGLSRGDRASGVMEGRDIRSYMPLHLSGPDRSEPLREWLGALVKDLGGRWLTPEGWFENNQEGYMSYLWTPPPAAGEVVVERLGFSRHKRPNCMHLVVIPRLMTGRWRRRLIRGSDIYFRLDNRVLWDVKTHHEPLFVFLCLPFLSHRPNLEAKEQLLEELRGLLCQGGMQEVDKVRGRRNLCKLLNSSWEVCSL